MKGTCVGVRSSSRIEPASRPRPASRGGVTTPYPSCAPGSHDRPPGWPAGPPAGRHGWYPDPPGRGKRGPRHPDGGHSGGVRSSSQGFLGSAMRLAGYLGRTRTRAGRPQGPGHGTRPVPRGSPHGSPHRPPSHRLASAGYGFWDLLRAPAGTKTCGPLAGRPVRGPLTLGLRRLPGPAMLHSSRPAIELRPTGSQPQKCSDPLGPPIRGRAGRPLGLAAPAIRWAVDHLPLIWGGHEPRPGSSGLARPHQVQKDPQAWGERAAPPGSVHLHWGERVLLLGCSPQDRLGISLGLGNGRSRRLRRTGVQDEPVAGEASSRGPRVGAGRVLRESMHLPPCEGAPSQGINNGLCCSLAARRPRTLLSAEVAEPNVVESASHAEPPTIVLGGIVPDDLVAALPLASPRGLVRFVPFEPWSALLEGPR